MQSFMAMSERELSSSDLEVQVLTTHTKEESSAIVNSEAEAELGLTESSEEHLSFVP